MANLHHNNAPRRHVPPPSRLRPLLTSVNKTRTTCADGAGGKLMFGSDPVYVFNAMTQSICRSIIESHDGWL
jgi:hypothetical protein